MSNIEATLEDLRWMCGGWKGGLGPQIVEECWSEPTVGTMSTMVRLTTVTETVMIELINIRETQGTLMLHLRQFSPALELVLTQDMPLAVLTPNSVAFDGPEGGHIQQLGYRSLDAESMEVDVTLLEGPVLTAGLKRV